MFIIIKDNYKIYKTNINDDLVYKGIHIYKKNNNHYIELKTGYRFSDNTKIKKLEVGSYKIDIQNVCYSMYLHTYDSDDGINDFKLYKLVNFMIAESDKANIKCLDNNLSDYYLAFKDGYLSTNFDISFNGKKYNDQKLTNGDVIEYLGIKVFYYDDFIYINSFNIDNKLKEYEINKSIIRYNKPSKLNNYYIPEVHIELAIDELKDYVPITKQSSFETIKSLLPNIVMCLAMSIMAYINYATNVNNNNILSFIIMPISMALTSVIIPIVLVFVSNSKYRKDDSNNKSEYLNYLNEYEKTINCNIAKYIESLNSHYFNLFDSKKMIFYLNQNNNDFLTLSIGKTIHSKNVLYKRTNVTELDNKITEIENTVNNINDYPLFLDLKKHKIVSIVSKINDKFYYFNRYLLETAYKHHYDDLYIAIYAINNNIFDNVYNLPHLFIGKKRLTINNEEQLRELDQSKLNKPLVLFMFDNCDYSFSNGNIHQIYFSSDINDIRKNSSIIIEHINNTGYIYDSNKTQFNCLIEDIDFKSYFSYLGRFLSTNSNDINYNFNNIFFEDLYCNSDTHSLKATFAYHNNQIISLDLHESKQGPHGLIGGSTGSGKSELIVSLLLSLCIRYSPEYLNIVLIDYKGGGIEESLTYQNIIIPHIVASISNLQNNALERLIIALHNECNYRQLLFKQLSNLTHISIMNLDDYIDNNLGLCNLPSIAHLIVVVDEFAELKKENPEQIKELISISRIGRSLGLHLILATQKPAGVIDEQIWSNSRFKIALKVFDEKDSNDIIKCNDAANLFNPGSFLMKIDNSLIKGQSIYTKNDIDGNDPYKVSILNNELDVVKSYKKQTKDIYTTASYYANKIIQTSLNRKYNVRTIDFMPPEPLNREDISINNNFIFGQIDDYINGNKQILKYDIKESILIYSSRKNEINSILNTLNDNKRKCVVIGSRIYEGTSITDSILNDNSEDIDYLFDYLTSNKNNDLSLVIEDLNCLLSYEDGYLNAILKLIKRSKHLNLSLVFITSTAELNFKIINAFKNKVAINILEQNDLSSFFGARSKYKGNSFFYSDELIPFVPINEEYYIRDISKYENIIKHIPTKINPSVNGEKILIGYDEKTKEMVYANKDINIFSYDEKLIRKYIDAYSDINACVYSNSMNVDDNKPILWLGSGIFNQRIFMATRRDDINDNQGIYINNGIKILIRSLKYE